MNDWFTEIHDALDTGAAWVDTNIVGCIEAEERIEHARLVTLPHLQKEIELRNSALERTLFLAEHLWQMIPQSVWRDSGGDDMQGHYEGDFHAEKVREEFAEIRAALVDTSTAP